MSAQADLHTESLSQPRSLERKRSNSQAEQPKLTATEMTAVLKSFQDLVLHPHCPLTRAKKIYQVGHPDKLLDLAQALVANLLAVVVNYSVFDRFAFNLGCKDLHELG